MPHYKAPFLFLFQSTPSARRATDRACKLLCNIPISIHALREESDGFCGTISSISWEFQSTPSARRATLASWFSSLHASLFQSTPSARRATVWYRSNTKQEVISIHALREESDCLRPAGERTRKRISIHALREESDSISKSPFTFVDDFNPRPPRGERPRDLCGCVLHGIDFNPRPPRGERPEPHRPQRDVPLHFNPRPPRGERPIPQVLPALLFAISIHALCEESDRRLSSHSCRTGNFNPRPPRGERRSLDGLTVTGV